MKNFEVLLLKDSIYGSEIYFIDEKVIYCELRYERDRSSFAGVALKLNNQKKDFVVRECSELMVKEESKYEKIYIGFDKDYVDSIRETLSLEECVFGIEIYFLVYSDIRSSQMIFEELTKEIVANINRLYNLDE